MKNQSRTLRLALAGALCTAGLGGAAYGQSADALIDKLVDKGVLTVKEGNELREEADKDFTKAYSVKSGMPDWVTALKFNGDVRLRYENFNYANGQAAPGATTAVDRHRFRYRLRFGATAALMDNLEVGLRLTSSEAAGAGGDPISGNTSFSGNAGKKLIYVDLAYAKWTALNNADWKLELTGGKMENPFVYSDMTFDKDYTPEGAGFQLTHPLNDKHTLKLTGGAFVVNEVSTLSDDAYLFGVQARWDAAWSPKLHTTLGGAWFGLTGNDNLLTASVPNQNRGNTRTAAGELRNNYNPFMVDAGITYTLEKFPLYKGAFPIKLEGDFIYNPVVNQDNYGWSSGLTFGKSGKRGMWDLAYRYKYLGADAWYEELVDSDFGGYYGAAPVGGAAGYGAGTNVRGHILKLQYSPFDSTTIAVTYFLTDLINSTPAAGARNQSSDAGRLQVDISWKF